MLIDKYTKHSVFSLPQIFYGIFDRHDLKRSKFVNMYVHDINKPLLSNHVFLVFHDVQQYLIDILQAHPLFNVMYSIKVDRIPYTIFAFNRAYTIHTIVNKIDYGLYERLGYEQKLKILNFWEVGVNSKVHRYLFNPTIKTTKPLCENITAQDK